MRIEINNTISFHKSDDFDLSYLLQNESKTGNVLIKIKNLEFNCKLSLKEVLEYLKKDFPEDSKLIITESKVDCFWGPQKPHLFLPYNKNEWNKIEKHAIKYTTTSYTSIELRYNGKILESLISCEGLKPNSELLDLFKIIKHEKF